MASVPPQPKGYCSSTVVTVIVISDGFPLSEAQWCSLEALFQNTRSWGVRPPQGRAAHTSWLRVGALLSPRDFSLSPCSACAVTRSAPRSPCLWMSGLTPSVPCGHCALLRAVPGGASLLASGLSCPRRFPSGSRPLGCPHRAGSSENTGHPRWPRLGPASPPALRWAPRDHLHQLALPTCWLVPWACPPLCPPEDPSELSAATPSSWRPV